MPATALLTSGQFLALPEEFDQNGNRIKDELIGGEVVKMPPPSQLHNLIKINILEALIAYSLANRRLAIKPLAEMAFMVGEHDTLVPDASVVTKSRLNPRESKYIAGAPELAIEVVSPTDTAAHLKGKIDAYLQNGSKTVWVVYPDSRSVVVYSGDTVRELKANQKIEDPLLPGFAAPVSSFFDLT